jgi:hypothetical protein
MCDLIFPSFVCLLIISSLFNIILQLHSYKDLKNLVCYLAIPARIDGFGVFVLKGE